LEKLSVCRDKFHGYDYTKFINGTDLQRAKTISGAVNFIISREKVDDKDSFVKEALMLHQALSLCSSLVDEDNRFEAAFFEAVRVLVLRLTNTGVGKKISLPEMNARINELLKQSIKSDGVINLFSDIKEEFSLFDPKFLQDVANMKEKNLAVELLKKLIAEQVSVYRRTNIVKSEKFSEIMQRAINAYLNGMLTNEEVIEEINQENQPSIGDSLKVVLSNKGIWLVSICIMMVLGSTVTLSTFMPVALQNMYGIDLKVCGTIASMLTLGNYIGSITGPIVFYKIKNVKVFVSGAAVLSFAGIIMCWRFPSIFVLHILVLYTGIMLGASMPIFLSAPVLLEGLGTKYAGSAAGVISTLQLLGAVLIPTYILTPIAGENYSLLFMLASICMVIMFLCGLLLPQFGNNQK